MKSRVRKRLPYDIKPLVPDMELLASIGYDRMIEFSDFTELQVKFLEAYYGLWTFSKERNLIEKRHDVGILQKKELREAIKEAEMPVKQRMKDINYCIVFLRLLLDYTCDHVIHTSKKLRDTAIAFQEEEKRTCKDDYEHFINFWCWIHEPRILRLGINPNIPFILYPKQAEILSDIHNAFTTGGKLLIEKSREAGITWAFVAYYVWHWVYSPNFDGLLASEKEAKLDKIGNVNTIFGKARHIIYNLPFWMLPTTYQKEDEAMRDSPNDKLMNIFNPDNSALISGEIGENIGRSGRASIVTIDEEQAIENPEALDSGCESVSECRIDVGTPLGMNHFGIRRHGGGVPVSTIAWHHDPRKNLAWKESINTTIALPSVAPDSDWLKYKQESERDKTILAQEYFLDYAASSVGSLIESNWVKSAVNFATSFDGGRAAGFDVADGGKNQSIYTKRIGVKIFTQKTIDFKAPSDNVLEVIRLCKADNIESLSYDRDGVGISVPAVIKLVNEKLPFQVIAVRGQENASERFIPEEGKRANELYYNKRAELYYELMYRFKKTYEHVNKIKFYPENELISIPDDPELILQLSQIRRKFIGRKQAIWSKIEMRAKNIASPDKADSLNYSFADMYLSEKVLNTFDYTDKKEHYVDFDIDNFGATDQFVSIYQTPDFIVSAIGAQWNGYKQQLRVYWNLTAENVSPETVIYSAKSAMKDDIVRVKEWIGNDEIFKGLTTGKKCLYYGYKKAGVNLRQNHSNEDMGAITIVNEMFENSTLVIKEPDCELLMYQVLNWEKQHGKPSKNMGLVLALCQLVTRLRTKRVIKTSSVHYDGFGIYRNEEGVKVKSISMRQAMINSIKKEALFVQ